MNKNKRMITIVATNCALFCVMFTIGLQIVAQIANIKSISQIRGENINARMRRALLYSKAKEELRLTIGDSFAYFNIGHGNGFDDLMQCTGVGCNYVNLSEPGRGLEYYFGIANKVLSKRDSEGKTKLLLVTYAGNDLIIPDINKANCKKIHLDVGTENEPIKEKAKRIFPGLVLLNRLLKNFVMIPKEEQELRVIRRATILRNYLKLEKDADLGTGKIERKLLDEAVKDKINPWEIALAVAYPRYYEHLYGLGNKWLKQVSLCTIENIRINVVYLKDRYPGLDISLIIIPDKIAWSRESVKKYRREYEMMGYDMRNMASIFREYSGKMDITKYMSILVEQLSATGISVYYLPGLIDYDAITDDIYFEHDMHLNDKAHMLLKQAKKKFVSIGQGE